MNINHIKVYDCTRHFWLKQLKINCTYPGINMLVWLKKNRYAQPSLISQDVSCAQCPIVPILHPFLDLSLTGLIILTSGMHAVILALKSLLHLHITLTITHTISYSPGALPNGHHVLQTFPKYFRAPPYINKTSVIYGHRRRMLTSFTNCENPLCIDFKMMSTWTLVDVSDIV